jgi:hypothetical protein
MRDWGFKFGVWGVDFGFGVQNVKFWAKGLRCRVSPFPRRGVRICRFYSVVGLRVQGDGVRISGLGLGLRGVGSRVEDLGFRIKV